VTLSGVGLICEVASDKIAQLGRRNVDDLNARARSRDDITGKAVSRKLFAVESSVQ